MASALTRRALFAAPLALAAAPAPARPNIVIVLADDLGYGDLSSFGAADLRTPHIDGIASAGVRFDRFYANSPVCSPTRAALLTGRYPDRAGVPGVIRTDPASSWGRLAAPAEVVARPLAASGYHTAIVGKWHLGLEAPNLPNLRGFHHFHGFLGDMMDDYFTHRRFGRNYMRRNDAEIDPQGHATDLFTDWAIEYLDSRRGSRQPFFLYLAYNAPHTPVQPKPDWLAKVRARQPGMTDKRAALAALIEHMDDGVGRVMAALQRNGQAGNTLFVFVSDNGGHLPSGASCGALRGGKEDMFEGGIRVPMCATWPGRIAPGSRSEAVALTMDLYSTTCEAAGARPAEGVDGVSLLPEMLGRRAAPPPRDLVWVRREGGPRYQGRDYYALRRGDWKLLQNSPFEPYALYNLAADPGETRDLAKAEPKLYRELWQALARRLQRAGVTPWQ